MNVAPRVQRFDTLLQGLLDRGFQQKVAPVINALTSDARVRTALSAFQKEAERLAAAGEPLTRDNPALLNLRSTLARAIDDQATHIDNAGKALANDAAQAGQYGARQLSLFGLDTQTQVAVSSAWNRPDPAAIARVVDTTSGKPWLRALDTFGDGVAERVNKIAVAGIIDGQNPMDIARSMTTAVDSIPRSQAEALLRTLQLNSYRGASAESYAANLDILEPMGIRIAALDDRTCPACIELHGTLVPVDEDIEEHYSGRCTVVPVVKGFPRDIQTGEAWFDAQDAERQQAILGKAAYNAWNDGAVTLADFVGHTNDPIFGQQLQTNSLKGILGNGAKQYYAYNYNKN